MAGTQIVAALADVPEHGLHQVEIGTTKILLFRDGERVRALQGTCPHAGGPLAQGVLDGARVICPWHKAAFCTRTGKLLDPPAVDDLSEYPVTTDGDRLTIDLPPHPAPPLLRPGPAEQRCFVVIGGGGAGAAAVRELRAAGFTGRLVLIDREDALPYDRTLLSKYDLSGETGGEKSPLHDMPFYRKNKIERRIGNVTGLDPDRKIITFGTGDTLIYDAALLATGSRVIPAPFPGAAEAGVFLLRDRRDTARIVAAATGAKRAAVIGASFIGMEVAAALTERGLDVTVVATESAPFEKQLGPKIGGVFQRLHEQHGVKFHFGAKIARLQGGKSKTIVLEDGAKINADLIVAGLGVRPATEFVAGLTRDEDQALVVGADLKVMDGLYAAGDIAAFPLWGDGPLTRVEHWRVAQQHGRVAARAMLGQPARYEAVPMFWTIQYMKRLDYVGHASAKDELVVRGDLEKPEFIAYYLRDGKVAAAAGFDRDSDMAAIVALMESRHGWTVEDLHPPDGLPATVLAAGV